MGVLLLYIVGLVSQLFYRAVCARYQLGTYQLRLRCRDQLAECGYLDFRVAGFCLLGQVLQVCHRLLIYIIRQP